MMTGAAWIPSVWRWRWSFEKDGWLWFRFCAFILLLIIEKGTTTFQLCMNRQRNGRVSEIMNYGWIIYFIWWKGIIRFKGVRIWPWFIRRLIKTLFFGSMALTRLMRSIWIHWFKLSRNILMILSWSSLELQIGSSLSWTHRPALGSISKIAYQPVSSCLLTRHSALQKSTIASRGNNIINV